MVVYAFACSRNVIRDVLPPYVLIWFQMHEGVLPCASKLWHDKALLRLSREASPLELAPRARTHGAVRRMFNSIWPTLNPFSYIPRHRLHRL